MVECDIHTRNNLRVLHYLKDVLGADQIARDAWYRHWVELGLAGVEVLLVMIGHTLSFVCELCVGHGRRVDNSAPVPRGELRPPLLLDVAALSTRHPRLEP